MTSLFASWRIIFCYLQSHTDWAQLKYLTHHTWLLRNHIHRRAKREDWGQASLDKSGYVTKGATRVWIFLSLILKTSLIGHKGAINGAPSGLQEGLRIGKIRAETLFLLNPWTCPSHISTNFFCLKSWNPFSVPILLIFFSQVTSHPGKQRWQP